MIALDTSRFALAPDAVAIRVSDLPEALRNATASTESDVIWTQGRSRTPSFVVGADAAELLREFDRPLGIADAVLRFGTARDRDPKQVLREAYPLLREAVDRGLLVAESEWNGLRTEPALRPGQVLGAWTIARCVQSLTDGEVYEARNDRGDRVAVKVARSVEAVRRQDHEAWALHRLDGSIAPRLIARGAVEGSPYLVLEWREGQSPRFIAEQLRAAHESARIHLLQLASAIVDAYWLLHQRGLVHGDVHPLNLIVDQRGAVTLLDFEAVREVDSPAGGSRGFVAYYLEPETARAMLEGRPFPPATPRGEQFAVGALLFELFTGERYLDFRLERERFLRQVCTEPPRSFASCGVRAWPALERVLSRSLAKDPAQRFETLADLGDELRALRDRPARSRPSTRPHRRWLNRQLLDLAPGADAFQRAQELAPYSSLYSGLAGSALVHLRLAHLRKDPDHLAAADCWCARAEYMTSDPDAHSSPSIREAKLTVSRAALLHGPPGVALVRAMIGHARCDSGEVDRACRWFLRSASARCPSPDLTLGRSGVVFCAAAFHGMPSLGARERDAVQRLGRDTVAALVLWAEKVGGPANPLKWRNLGMAHGWAGILYAMIRWSESDPTTPLPSRMPEWLDALAGRGERLGRRLSWPWVQDRHGSQHTIGYASGWCNGSAGFVPLWIASHRVLGCDEDLRRMEGAALDAWLSDGGAWSLCCGTTGRAFALLCAARYTGERRWLSRARVLASRAVRLRQDDQAHEHKHSLFRGDAGLALLLAELDQPGIAAFPVFESHS